MFSMCFRMFRTNRAMYPSAKTNLHTRITPYLSSTPRLNKHFCFGKSSGGRLLICSIGIPPPRLHCGRAANYGSIMIPCACHRRLREQPGFLVFEFIAPRIFPDHGARTIWLDRSVSTGNVPDEWVFCFQGS